mmetsp:Transcript_5092/g.12218  ORF Transcript_5092/g.12218 Transcript_5092/m.12218 type:complete len:103 (-) Transcript_5092:113-421(-)
MTLDPLPVQQRWILARTKLTALHGVHLSTFETLALFGLLEPTKMGVEFSAAKDVQKLLSSTLSQIVPVRVFLASLPAREIGMFLHRHAQVVLHTAPITIAYL